MTKYRILFLVFVLGLFLSCEKDSNNATSNPTIIGTWISPSYDGNLIILNKSNNLKDNDYGIEFRKDASLVERKNSGWCGTPPISYSDFNGTWHTNDSLILISVDYWGGQTEYKWKLIFINDETLMIMNQIE